MMKARMTAMEQIGKTEINKTIIGGTKI